MNEKGQHTNMDNIHFAFHKKWHKRSMTSITHLMLKSQKTRMNIIYMYLKRQPPGHYHDFLWQLVNLVTLMYCYSANLQTFCLSENRIWFYPSVTFAIKPLWSQGQNVVLIQSMQMIHINYQMCFLLRELQISIFLENLSLLLVITVDFNTSV